MNRADTVRAVLACEALAKELRAALVADARAEYDEQGTVPTWRLPGVTAAASTSNPTAVVADEKAFTDWVSTRNPTEVETVTITRVRDAWRTAVLGTAVKLGAACTADGEVIPGVEYRSGGEYRSLSLNPERDLKDQLREYARDIAAGRRPLALPSAEEVQG